MKRKDLDRALRAAGWSIIPGGSHDMAVNPEKPVIKIPLPRHKEVNENTAKSILKAAGLK